MSYIRNISRLLVGLVFIFSGFVKLIDPYGFAYKFADYFSAMHLGFISDLSMPFAIIMSVIELVAGLCLFFNLITKTASIVVLLFMIVFTPLTLWLAIANPVTDCGCFGDALTISNWQSFFKNLILLALSVLIFYHRENYKSMYSRSCQLVLTLVFLASSTALSIYCLKYLPIIDFRPYHIGANIKEGMIIPESEKDNKDIFESSFIYEKDGKQKEFSIDNIPGEDWIFVDAKHKLIKEGYKPPIHDFNIEAVNLSSNTDEVVLSDDYVNLYDVEFIYENGQEQSIFSIENLPDNNWSFVETLYPGIVKPENIVIEYITADGENISQGIFDERNDSYMFLDATYLLDPNNQVKNTGDIRDKVLNDTNYSFIAIILKVSEANEKALAHLNQISEFCKNKSYSFYCLTGSNENEIKEFIEKHNPSYNFYNTDPTTLKTIIRSNPGLLLIKEGTILNKWSSRNLPIITDLNTNLSQYAITELQTRGNRHITFICILSALLFMSLATSLYYWLIKNRYINNN